ncbi:Uncharacterized protein HZ326_26832 [Fusarium oxysporum f. sp. albedinis]|nr:Uncharacterized protein HZ326_26832 [Fusarium oxysporum f. sp. albedinis]
MAQTYICLLHNGILFTPLVLSDFWHVIVSWSLHNGNLSLMTGRGGGTGQKRWGRRRPKREKPRKFTLCFRELVAHSWATRV